MSKLFFRKVFSIIGKLILMVVLALLYILVPIGSIAVVNWTKTVSFLGSELSFATVRMTTLGTTINYVYMAGVSPYTGPSNFWLYVILAAGFLVFCWWFLGMDS